MPNSSTLISIDQEAEGNFSLYFHFPFCNKKCPYCHFYVLKDKSDEHRALFEAYKQELLLYKDSFGKQKLVSIYFGGGTPSLADPSLFQELLNYIYSLFEYKDEGLEITLEVNPESLNFNQALRWKEIGVNRCSIGVQSFDDQMLQLLGREHNSRQSVQAILDLNKAGIDNLSIDLMYELPKLTLKCWEETLKQAISLPITHLSLYNLTFEPKTVFKRQQKKLNPLLPSEEDNIKMYQMLKEYLASVSIFSYEISAFCKQGYYSRHNTGYWLARPFLGVGPSAFSYLHKERFQNTSHLQNYLKFLNSSKAPVDFREKLTTDHARRELFLIELRLKQGLCLKSFEKRHGSMELSFINKLEYFIRQGLIHFVSGSYMLSEKGILLYDSIASELI
ncbi:MAG: radical SAM family heme chaperone HemW [Chlamydiales bacterium]|nr:radical SAM family heme chaperone HemW [Chlamydiales bacterium]